MRKDFSLDAGESGKKLLGFPGVKLTPTILLNDEDPIGALQAIFSPGHTPGHMAFLDVRDGSLIAGDAFTTPTEVLAAGTFKLLFSLSCPSRGTVKSQQKARRNSVISSPRASP